MNNARVLCRRSRTPSPTFEDSLRVILVAHLALSRAFELLRSKPPAGFVLSTAKEDEITLELYRILEDSFLDSGVVAGFDHRRFRNVVRAPEVPNYDDTHPAKKPDLVAFLMEREHLSVRPSQDALFAECKPVDDTHAVGQHYCDSGIRRFVTGDYAWAMQEGMMVAYVRGQRTIDKHLIPALASEGRQVPLGAPCSPVVVLPQVCNGEPFSSRFINGHFHGLSVWEKLAKFGSSIRGIIVNNVRWPACHEHVSSSTG